MGQIIKIRCNCGKLLFKYHKDKKGRLIKCFLDEIRKAYIRFDKDVEPICPSCNKSIGRIELVKGRLAIRIKQTTVSMRT